MLVVFLTVSQNPMGILNMLKYGGGTLHLIRDSNGNVEITKECCDTAMCRSDRANSGTGDQVAERDTKSSGHKHGLLGVLTAASARFWSKMTRKDHEDNWLQIGKRLPRRPV